MPSVYLIEGNIGSGKSTLLRIMKKHVPDIGNKEVVYIEEPVKVWDTIKDKDGESVLVKFYNNQRKYAFPFQMMAYISRISELRKALKKYDENTIIVCERSVYTDKNVFCKMLYDSGIIEETEFIIYNKWFDEFVDNIEIKGVVYLDVNPNVCMQRIAKRNRNGEEGVSLEYLQKCKMYHDTWLNTYENILRIQDDEESKQMEWLNKVIKFME